MIVMRMPNVFYKSNGDGVTPPPIEDNLLMESGDEFLLEDGDNLLTE